jgi:hypothetical protein
MLTDPFVPVNERRSGYIHSPPRPSATERHSPRRARHDAYHHEPSSEIFPNTPGSFPLESWPDLPAPVVTANSHYPATKEQSLGNTIDVCVTHLKALGFGDMRDGDGSRLRVYAEASDGNLEDAIEMIEEERKVYEQRSSLF